MKTSRLMPEEKLLEKGVTLLLEELGPVEASRFLALSPGKRMDSVRRHRRWQTELTKDSLFDDVFGDG